MNNSFLGKRLKGCFYAIKGALLLIKNEASIQVQFVIAILITIAGFYFEISKTEWMFQIFAIAIVMSAEGLNTAVEEIANFLKESQFDMNDRIAVIAKLLEALNEEDAEKEES